MAPVQGGYVILARKVQSSDIWRKPGDWLKIWLYILQEVSHKDKVFKRGQNFFRYEDMARACGVGYTTVDHCIRWLKSARQIATQKTTRGTIVSVLNYDKYQSVDSYYNDTKSDECGEIEAKQKRNGSGTINKNERMKERKKEKTTNVVKASPSHYEDGTKVIILKDEVMSQIDERDRSFPRKRTFGNEKVDWTLDYTEHLLGRKLTGQERWNRIYARHLTNKLGMTKVKELLEYVCSPNSWWFDKLSQMSTLYKNSDRLMAEKDNKAPVKNNIAFIS